MNAWICAHGLALNGPCHMGILAACWLVAHASAADAIWPKSVLGFGKPNMLGNIIELAAFP